MTTKVTEYDEYIRIDSTVDNATLDDEKNMTCIWVSKANLPALIDRLQRIAKNNGLSPEPIPQFIDEATIIDEEVYQNLKAYVKES